MDQILQQAIEHHQAGRLVEAEEGYRLVLEQNPDHFYATNNLGLIAFRAGRHAEAIDLLQRAVQLDPSSAASQINLGVALRAAGQPAAAVAAYQRAIQLAPNNASAHTNLGNALRDLGEPHNAVAALRKAVEIDPNYTMGHNILGGGLANIGDFHGAIAAFRRAIEIQPDLAGAHFNLALAMLQLDDPKAWEQYEWRWKFDGFANKPRNFPQPRWSGEDLRGKTILLHAEQGLGDTIQFIRYVPHVAVLGGRVVVECQAPLKSLIEQMPGVSRVIEQLQPLPEFDFHCPLLTLPLVCGIIPACVPYLSPPPQLVSHWNSLLSKTEGKLRVGLVWAGSPAHHNDKQRSMRLDQFAPLARVNGVCFYTLQKGPAAQQACHPPARMELVDHAEKLKDMSDTAALITHLDLIISVDTSVAHLAGAMGKPVWILLPFVPAWQWLVDRDETHWYPTAELFRQPTFGDWDNVIQRVVQRLEMKVSNQKPPINPWHDPRHL